jgi:hypothetical protein
VPLNTPLTQELDRQGRRRDWLAERLGVKPWTFSRIEAGVQTPPDGWYERAADILGVPIATVEPQREVAA